MNKKPDFSNTKYAFYRFPTIKLIWNIFVFQIMNNSKKSKILQNFLENKLKSGGILAVFAKFALKITAFQIFCGGENIESCRKTISNLKKTGVSTILDYSKESGDEITYDKTVAELLRTINEAKANKNVSFAVFKFTGIGDINILEKISSGLANSDDKNEFQKIKERANILCNAAYEKQVKILVDAEHSWIQNAIDSVTEEMMILYNKSNFIVYNTIQLYRNDRLQYLMDLHERLKIKRVKTAVKLVRGAYMDIERERALKMGYPSPIHTNKSYTDEDYNAAINYCLSDIENIAICAGTHNQESCELLVDLMDKNELKENTEKIYFAQLYGMADIISNNLGVVGYNVAKYVPYGKISEVMPYLFRRADENKAALGEMSRELSVRQKELKRRLN